MTGWPKLCTGNMKVPDFLYRHIVSWSWLVCGVVIFVYFCMGIFFSLVISFTQSYFCNIIATSKRIDRTLNSNDSLKCVEIEVNGVVKVSLHRVNYPLFIGELMISQLSIQIFIHSPIYAIIHQPMFMISSAILTRTII